MPGGSAPIMTSTLSGACAVLLAALMLAAPAAWNGFPLLYWDSADYLAMPFDRQVPVFRSGSYAIVTAAGRLLGSPWAIVAVQALLVAYLIHEAVAAFAPRRTDAAFLGIVLGLCLLTGLPWYASQVMADAFVGPLVLGVAALAFGRMEGWSWARKAALVLGLGVAAAVHSTHVALTVGLLLVFAALWAASWLPRLGWLRVRPPGAAAVIAVGIALAVAANWALTGRAFLAQPIGTLTFARMVQDGTAKRYLGEVCPETPELRMCAIRDRLPPTANLFLWMPGPFYEVGGWAPEVEAEAKRIVSDSLSRDPLAHAASALGLTWKQFRSIASGEGLIDLDTIHRGDSVETNPFMPKVIANTYPGSLDDYRTSRQREDIDLRALNAFQVPLAFAAVAALAGLTVLGFRRRDRTAALLGLTVLLALLGNAFICGALSNPADRYQGRIVWIALAAAALLTLRPLTTDERHR